MIGGLFLSGGDCSSLAEANEGQDSENDYNCSNKPYDAVHVSLLMNADITN